MQKKLGAGFFEKRRRLNLWSFLRNYKVETDTFEVRQGNIIMDFPYDITNRMKRKYFKVIREKSKYYLGNTTWLRVPIIIQKH